MLFRSGKKKNGELEDFREDLPIATLGQGEAELEKPPLGPEED